jgi:hypothetical protein
MKVVLSLMPQGSGRKAQGAGCRVQGFQIVKLQLDSDCLLLTTVPYALYLLNVYPV